jgi:hypothetical protein
MLSRCEARLPMLKRWTKANLINRIAKLRGYRSYLEISTAYSGFRYRQIDRDILTTCHRLMYQCPSEHSDGMPIDFRSADLDIAECLREVQMRGCSYDIVLVDSWHEYATSRRDLIEALGLIAEGGTVVVHDCLADRERTAQPTFTPGDWRGVTYKAYLDFVLAQSTVDYRTVDIDCGCGIIRKRALRAAPSDERRALQEEWAAIGDDYSAAFRFMREHRLLWNLVELKDFFSEEEQATRRVAPGSTPSSAGNRMVSFFERRFG